MSNEKIYNKVRELSEEIGNLTENTIGEDGMSIIIGIANADTHTIESLCASGDILGIWAMLNSIMNATEGEIENDTKTPNGNLS